MRRSYINGLRHVRGENLLTVSRFASPHPRYQKNTGRRACIFLLLLIIFGLIIVLIFKPRRHASSAPSPPSVSALSPDTGALFRLPLDSGSELNAAAALLRRHPDR